MEKDLKYYIRLGFIGKQEVNYARDAIREYGKALGTIPTKADEARNAIVKWGSMTTMIDNAQSSIRQVTDVMNGFIQKANAATESQTKLQTIMRERMSATEDDVKSINELISKQTELGVVSGTVQRAGMQQLATFASQKQTLLELLPAMNNLLVQQNGLSSTAENATSIANLMGKALMGNFSALTRVGVTLTDTQKELIKTGDEGTRAKAIAEAITQNVGKMNEEMAKTDAGKAKKAANEFAGLQTKIGSLLSPLQFAITKFGQFGFAMTGVIQLGTSLKGLSAALGITTLAQNLVNAAWAYGTKNIQVLKVAMVEYTWAQEIEGKSALAAAASTTLFKTALRGLMIATGIGAVLIAVGVAFDTVGASADKSSRQLDKSKDSLDAVAEATEEAKNQIADQVGAYNLAIAKTKGFKGTKAEEKKVVDELNSTYGDTFGTYATVAQWYQTLTANAKNYTNMLLAQARMQILVNKAAKDQLDLEQLERERPDLRGTTVTAPGGRQITIPKVKNDKFRDTAVGSRSRGIDLSQVKFKLNPSTGKFEATDLVAQHSTLVKSIAQETSEIEKLQKVVNQFKPVKITPAATEGSKETSTTARRNTPSTTSNRNGSATDITNKPKTLIQKDTMSKADYENNSEYYQQEIDKLDVNNAKDARRLEILKQQKKLVDDILDKYSQLDNAKIPPLPDNELATYDQLDYAVQYYSDELRKASGKDRPAIQSHIDKLNELRQSWEEAAKTQEYAKGSAADLQAQIREIDEYLNKKKLTAYVRAQLRASKDDLQRQLDDMTGGSLTIPAEATPSYIEKGSMYDREQSYQNASTKFSKIRSNFDNGLISKDEAKKQVADLNAELSRIGNGIKPFRLEGIGFDKTFSDIQNGWNGIKGVEGGIEGITNALSGNKNAWETLTGVIDGAIQVISSIQAITGFVHLLSGGTTAAAAASGAAATATGSATAALTAQTSATIPAIAANKALSASVMEAAAAEYLAAHAYIPFAGFGIGASFAASAKALVIGMGATAFANGGTVPGTSYSGDRVLARVNSGEMILNAMQQARLFAIANGAMSPIMPVQRQLSLPSITMNTTDVRGGGMLTKGSVVFRIRRGDLVGVLDIDGKVGSKIGKRVVSFG